MTVSSPDVTADGGERVSLSPRFLAERPLTRTQELIWASQRLAPRAPIANMGKTHRIRGPIDPDRFAAAFDRVVAASDALRTIVHDQPGTPPRARVLARPPRHTEVIELDADEVEGWGVARIAQPIDITTCGYDSVLIRHGDDDWTWWLDLHHLVTDAFASSLVFDTVSRVYARLAGAPVDELPADPDLVAFGEHVAATTAPPDDAARQQRATFWDDQRADDHPITPYGPRGPRTTAVDRCAVELPDGLAASFEGPYRTLSRELSQLALFSVATATLLHRLDGREEVTLGIPIHHRSGADAPRVIGPLMELYPLRLGLSPDQTFAGAFRAAYQQIVAVLRHAKPGESPTSAYDAVVNVLTVRFSEFAGLPCETSWKRSGHVEAAHALRVQAYDYGDGLRVELDVNRSLSGDGAHVRLPEHFALVLDAAVADPDTRLDGFDLLTDHDRTVMAQLNPPALDAPELRPVHEVIAARLRSDPAAVTARCGERQLTAGELDRSADRLARWLVGEHAATGRRVGIRMRRSVDVLVAIHGVLRAGAAFVVLDPDDPRARHETIAADAELVTVLDELPDTVADGTADAPADVPVDGPVDVPVDVAVSLDDTAYVLYTSGSTGTPKGVPISHRGLADYLRFAAASYAPSATIVMALHSALVFDLTITSLFLPQLLGGRTIVLDGDPISVLEQLAADREINTLKATPSQLELLTRLVDEPLPVEIVIVGGEAFRRPVAVAFAERCQPGVRIFNEYGPTEAVVGCMIHEWDAGHDLGPDVPIGVASPGAEVHTLDRWGCRSPVGAWGELYVRRPGMAEGYLHLPELSAERFAPVPAIDGDPVYRTGDRVRVAGDVLVYGGRDDDQLKVQGVRLEPGEIEAALVSHPDIANAVVRVWSPAAARITRCLRCGLGTDVPGVEIDDTGVCSACREYEHVEPQTRDWFGTPADLDAIRDDARTRSRGEFDCLHLLSGGKDSTYALYQLVERGWRVHALTLDNGYISDGAKDNISRSVADLGISHEFVTTEAMAEIFRDSLDRYANVCNGCYKTIYTLATARAHELGIPVIVTGLSRGQFFETRLVPHQFEAGRFDPQAIDRTVLEARRAYHHTADAVTSLLPQQRIFDRDDLDVLAEIDYVDFYRYVDVELAEMYDFLEHRAPWVRPADTGRSTNCLINVAGIHVHRTERGYHNYAEPYSWDVRLGHKTRDEALDELDDDIDVDEVERILAEIGYEPKRSDLLTAWYQTVDGRPIDPAVLRAHLREVLPARSIPRAFVHVDEVPLAGSAKLDVAALPPPSRTHAGSTTYSPPATRTEVAAADVWAAVLDVERVGRDDDFFDLGGSSLPALETVAALEQRLGVALPDALVFQHRVLHEFAAAVDGITGSSAGVGVIPDLPSGEPAPLSPGQEAMLFECRAAPADTRYNVTRLYTIEAEIDHDRLRAAFATVVGRHAPLHTAFDAERTQLPVERALSFGALPEGAAEEFAADQRRLPFDLDHGPLVRTHVGPSPSGGTLVLVVIHHLCVDATTFDLLWDELDAAYHGRELAPLPTTYAAHGAWQRQRSAADREYWEDAADRTERAGSTTLPPPAVPGPDGYLEIPAGVGASELAAASDSTPFAAALAAVAIVLGAASRTGVVDLRITASTKDHHDADPLIGYFLNTLPVLVPISAGDSLRSVDRRAGGLVADALPHRAYPLAEIMRAARDRGSPPPDLSSMLAYQTLAPARWGDGAAHHRILASGTAVTDVTFFVQERDEDVRLGLEYRGDRLGPDDARRLVDGFATALEAICRRPHRPVAELWAELADADVRGEPLTDASTPVLTRFVEHAERDPLAIALVDPDGAEVTYGALLARAAALAGQIVDAVPEPRRVGVMVGRSAAMIEAILAAQLAGAAYVPIDPTSPQHRIDLVVEAAALDVVVGDDPSRALPGDPPFVHVAASRDLHAVVRLPQPNDDAYVIFTSGSTGTPNGVTVSHANLAASTAARPVFYGDRAPERFLLTSSIGFDSSLVALAWPLATGGAIVVPSEDDVHDVDRLGEVIETRGVTHVLMVPSLYRALLDRCADRLASVSTAIVAGEACPPDLVTRHADLLPGTELVNEYGPTETTVWATAHRCEPGDDPVPIGRPIAGVTARVAADDGRAVARGAVGELLIAGPGLTVGSQRPESFVEIDGERWYRTGDLVRVDAARRLLFLGRVDDQLNVGGVRIEPVELEQHLTSLPGIVDAVVVAQTVGGREALVAHVVGDADAGDPGTIRARLAERVATAAVPRRVVFHEALPRTSHGKLDRRRAAELPIDLTTAAVADDDRHDRVVEIWRTALDLPEIGPDADFFASGGDSISAVEIVTRLADLVDRPVPVSALLHAPTPRAMADLLGIDAGRDPAHGPAGAVARLVTMRTGEPGRPLVVLTAAWDDVHGYRELADAIAPGHTVVAVAVTGHRTGDLDDVDQVVTEAHRLLADHLDRHAEVAVVGWSIGGVVAFDLGHELAERGVDVVTIALLDTYFPGQQEHLWSNRWWKYKSMLRRGSFGAAAREFGITVRRRVRRQVAKVGRTLLAWAGEPVPRPSETTTPGGIPYAAMNHEPRPGPAPVVIYAADTTNRNRTVHPWSRIVPELRIVPIEGRHRGLDSIMRADRVGQIADDLNELLARRSETG